ncbi:MAG: ATP-binding cassette domain-containing protein [Rhodospirillales bacterium]|nr:ATP-binding cassette domain-containing protein [Rhodospirillales bacterium]MDE0712077.1 ATP-binding cassette domain-containing protein [Rhodospirillales bacterium]
MTNPPLLETIALTKRFGGVTAIDHVDFRVEAGELRCLIGPNGAGKSTFFRCLTGQLRPTAGHVCFGGEDITGATTHAIARRGVAIKAQIPALFNGLSVAENVRLATWKAGGRAARTRKTDEILAVTGLSPLAAQLAGSLPHGQRQWLELGLVMAGNPALMLLDEPTAGMTRQEVAQTAELVRSLAKERTVIVVEHDLQFIRMVAATVTVFHRGRILVEGPADAVMADQRVKEVYLGQPPTADTC